MKKEHIVRYKILYSIIILTIYCVVRGIPLLGLDLSAYNEDSLDAQNLLMQVMGGDRFRYSLFALGITPYMFGSLLTSMILQSWKSVTRETPKATTNSKMTMIITMAIAVPMSLMRARELKYIGTGNLYQYMAINCVAMIAGTCLIVFLLERNKKFGIGGQTTIFLANIISTVVTNILKADYKELLIALAMSLPIMILMIVMENAEFRIPVQRVSVYSEYAEDSYIAFKMNPIGIMPAMFAMSFYMIPLLIVNALCFFWPNNHYFAWVHTEMAITKPLGIIVYIVILFILTLVFSNLFIGPSDIADQMLKAGDSLVDIRAGKNTKGYLTKRLLAISIFSACIMSVCVAGPLILRMFGFIGDAAAALPTTLMMMVGMWCNLYQEFSAVKSFDSYEEFI